MDNIDFIKFVNSVPEGDYDKIKSDGFLRYPPYIPLLTTDMIKNDLRPLTASHVPSYSTIAAPSKLIKLIRENNPKYTLEEIIEVTEMLIDLEVIKVVDNKIIWRHITKLP